jgi:hypothetical protein
MISLKQFLTYSVLAACIWAVSCKKSKNDPVVNNNPNDTSQHTTAGAWSYAGNIIDANNVNAQAVISVDKYGTVYLLYSDGYNAQKATAMKLMDSSWTPIGNAGFSDGRADRLSLAIDDATGTLYACYVENTSAYVDRVRVMKYDGSAWILVGGAFFQTNSSSMPAISIDNTGAPCVAFVSFLGQAIFKKFDGTNWTDYYTADYKLKASEVGVAGGTNYIAYMWDTAFQGNKLDILTGLGGNYSSVNFSPAITPFSFTTTTDKDGTLYIAYENKEPGRQANLVKYYGTWSQIGKANFSQGIANGISASVSTDSVYTPYVIFRDGNNTAYVMRYLKESWQTVGNLSSGVVSHTSIAVDKDFIPYAAFTSSANGSVVVKRFK